MSRNTIKKVLLEGVTPPTKEGQADIKIKNNNTDLLPIIKALFLRVDGNVVRVQELLKSDYNQDIAYSTLTRVARSMSLREPKKRYGEYIFEPGQEMQHDTSPHRITLDGKVIKAQCAALVFAFSRKLYFQYYPRFTRFEAKAFLLSALEFMGGSCKQCVIDNTSVMLASGSGANALFSPEMVNFGRMFGFEWLAHAIGNPDRKGRVERPFFYIEKNFLAGRTFSNWNDINQQAIDWCNHYANQKIKRVLGKSPETVFIQEKPYLQPLPSTLPPVYIHCTRTVDSQGYVNIDNNRYTVPESLIDKSVEVYKYLREIRIFYKHEEIARHLRVIDQINQKIKIEGHHIKQTRMLSRQKTDQTEKSLLGQDQKLDAYVEFIKKQNRGLRPLSKLLHLKQTYPHEAFIAAIKRAHDYGLYDMDRLEALILKHIAGDFFNLPMDEE